MTITYTNEVTSCKRFGFSFLKLLARWKGSIYKLVWSDLLLYLFIYYSLNLSYRFVLTGNAKIYFENIVEYAAKHASLIPLSFVLGFFVDLVMERWWNQYSSIPYPDNLAILVGASIRGQDKRSRAVRRTIVRYACATFAITLTMISPKVKKRFRTLNHFVEAGLLTKDETEIMEELSEEFPKYPKYWLPLAWASNKIITSRQRGLIRNDEYVEKILDALNDFRDKCGGLLDYNWISVPLVYTQVVTIAVYSYFLVSVIGNQYINENSENIRSYFPIIPVLEFFFYMGWFKVAETLINPFGDDDDDFEVMWLIERHIQIVYLLVDKIPQKIPKLMKDINWDERASLHLNENSQESYTGQLQDIPMSQLPKVNTPVPKEYGKGKERITLKCATLESVVSRNQDEIDEWIPENDSDEETVWPVCDSFENLRQKRSEERQKRMQNIINSMEMKKTK